jgi:hypothetical protein
MGKSETYQHEINGDDKQPLYYISNNRSFRLKHPGVPDSSDCSD